MENELNNLRPKQEAEKFSMTRYFTGVPCSRGHLAERRVSNGACVDCNHLAQASWRKRNPHYSVSYEASSPKAKEIKLRARKKWRVKNPNAVRENKLRDARKHRDAYLLRAKNWKGKNRAQVVAIEQRRRSRKLNAAGSYTIIDVQRMLQSQNFICNGCGCDISLRYTVDHIIPLSRGGSNWPSNLQLLCRNCNSSKRSLTMDEWVIRKKQVDLKIDACSCLQEVQE